MLRDPSSPPKDKELGWVWGKVYVAVPYHTHKQLLLVFTVSRNVSIHIVMQFINLVELLIDCVVQLSLVPCFLVYPLCNVILRLPLVDDQLVVGSN